ESEWLGVGGGRPGQTFQLAQGNVLDGTLQIAVRESSDDATPLVSWGVVESLDDAKPLDSVFALDREAGTLQAGDGDRGRIVPLVPGAGEVVALTYKYGGGKSGEVGVG